MKYITFFIFCFSCLLLTSSAQSEPAEPVLYIYKWGIIDLSANLDTCERKMQRKYGFAYKSQGSCMMDDVEKIRRFNEHNEYVYEQLIRRHGGDWKEQYEKDVEYCRAL